MSGISSGVGVFSGIDTKSLIDQLLALEARPRAQAQGRVVQLQLQSSAYLDLNSKFGALKAAAAGFRTNRTFQSTRAVSSNADVLTATTSSGASAGSFNFIVDRLVTSQQLLSRGFANRDSSAVGATSVVVETAKARLDTDVSLSDLNNGQGVERGRIIITDSAARSITVDLSRSTTVQEALDAINSNGTAQVTASVEGGRFIVRDAAGGSLTIANAAGYTTATSLGIAGTGTGTITGSSVYSLNSTTTLASLNSGNGISVRNTASESAASFSIVVHEAGPTTNINVNLGDVWQLQSNVLTKTQGGVNTVGGTVDRINAALTAGGYSDITASIDSTNGRLVITDSTGTRQLEVVESGGGTTAQDLGLKTSGLQAAVVDGKRVLSNLNTVLLRNTKGGAGFTGDGVLNFTTRSGHAFSVTVGENDSLADTLRSIQSASGAQGAGTRISASLDSRGTGIRLTDNTGGGSNLIVTGTTGNDTAAWLGISTGAAGVASATKDSGNLQRQYISRATTLSSLNSGRGTGLGKFRIRDGTGETQEVDIGTDSTSLGDVIDEINSRGLRAKARINANGDGIEVYEDLTLGPAGAVKIKIEDVTGTVARSLNIAAEAPATGATNAVNGTFERTVALLATDTLQQVQDKINAARIGVSASIVIDGSGNTPFRLNLASTTGGAAGRYIVDAGAFNFGFSTLDKGNDSRAFFGATDAARGIVVGGSSNTVDNAVTGVRIDLKAPSTTPVTLTISSDSEGIETAVGTFISTFNSLVDRINFQTKYDKDTKRAGPLLGDSTALELKSALFRTIQGVGIETGSRYTRLVDVGVGVGKGGKLELDEERFREALATDPAGVEALFVARTAVDNTRREIAPGIFVRDSSAAQSFTSLGVVGQIEELANRYIDSVGGVLTGRGKSLTDLVTQQNTRITSMTERLQRKRTQLERQFITMEQTIAKLQGQQSALGSIQRVG